MTTELFWLTLTVGLTGIIWVPYILDRMATRGIMGTLGNPSPELAPPSPWAERMKAAHANAVENLVVFAPLVLTLHALAVSSPATQMAASVYFWARLVHLAVYTLGIPVVRTLAFVIGWGAQVVLFLAILGMI